MSGNAIDSESLEFATNQLTCAILHTEPARRAGETAGRGGREGERRRGCHSEAARQRRAWDWPEGGAQQAGVREESPGATPPPHGTSSPGHVLRRLGERAPLLSGTLQRVAALPPTPTHSPEMKPGSTICGKSAGLLRRTAAYSSMYMVVAAKIPQKCGNTLHGQR
jgi:hypothetical protein